VPVHVQTLDKVVIRFAGDSGDGMQLTGDRFTADTATAGNDFATLPNFPAEIRAPQGTIAGVSSFQLHFADVDIKTPGDRPDVLVAMNPAALRANLSDLRRGGVVIADTHEFTPRNLAKVGYRTTRSRTGRSTTTTCTPSTSPVWPWPPSSRSAWAARTPRARRTCTRSGC